MKKANSASQSTPDWKEDTISHRDLLKKEIAPLEYLVEDLLVTPGLVVFAGKKKIGKSWMALQLAQSVASGESFLGKATKQGTVVYLALEDGERRLKQRLESQSTPLNLPITYSLQWPPLNSTQGFGRLISTIRDLKPGLVVIDTLASARDKRIKENEADSMGELFNLLHSLAIKGNTVILIVSHHGKKLYEDIGFDIRGSSAIAGATDANIGLYKNNDGSFTLKAEGRDIPEVDLRVKFDAEVTWAWQCQGDDRDIRRVEAEARILEVIESLGEAYAPDIAKELGIARPTVYNHLKRMRTEGTVECEIVNTTTGAKTRYKLPQRRGATSPSHLSKKPVRDSRPSRGNGRLKKLGSRGVGKVGAKSGVVINSALTGEEDEIADEDVLEFARRIREGPEIHAKKRPTGSKPSDMVDSKPTHSNKVIARSELLLAKLRERNRELGEKPQRR